MLVAMPTMTTTSLMTLAMMIAADGDARAPAAVEVPPSFIELSSGSRDAPAYREVEEAVPQVDDGAYHLHPR